MNRRWLITGLIVAISLGAAYFAWQGMLNTAPVETAQKPDTTDGRAALPPMDQLTYKKIETATFAMG